MRRTATPLLVLVLLVPGTAVAQTDSGQAEVVEVSAESPPSVFLAFHDLGSVRLPADTVDAYQSKLTRLAHTCRDSPESLAGATRGAAQILQAHASRRVSTYELLDRLEHSTGGPMNAQPRCDELLSSIVVSLGGERLRLPKIKITSKLENMSASGAGGGSGGR